MARLNPRRRAKRRQQLQIAKNEAILRGPPPKPDPLSDPYVAAINAKTAQYQAQVEIYDAQIRALQDEAFYKALREMGKL